MIIKLNKSFCDTILLMKYFILLTLFCSIEIQTQTEFGEAIEDNSFLIEEAYNQEENVVQHISNVMHFSKPAKEISLSFTQEWPFFSQMHQLSFTIPYTFLNFSSISGFNDMLINYRYQLFNKDDWAAVSPRISIVIPTGNYKKGLGSDVIGFQIAIPFSKRFSEKFVSHTNIGINFLPNSKSLNYNQSIVKSDLTDYFVGISLIWLTDLKLNFMLEYLYLNTGEPGESGIERISEYIINPGIRGAIDLNSLQIVPGLAVPFNFSSGEVRTGLFLYLSFEHPF